MDSSVKCLTNSISRFIHLVSCQNVKLVPLQKDYKILAGVLKLLKPVLEGELDFEISSDESLCKECEELDVAVNMAREFMEDWTPTMSKIHSVLQSEPLLMKIQSTILGICRALHKFLQLSSPDSSSTTIEQCIQDVQSLKQERIAKYIEDAMRKSDIFLSAKSLLKVIELLGLASSQELLKEHIALGKERMNAKATIAKGDINQIDQIVDLVNSIRDCLVKHRRLDDITIPAYFCCPLSSELMLDPVIVASGQTYERYAIEKWLESGLTICPKTRQKLAHTNVITNYTVKAMIATWCEENKVKLPVNIDRWRNVSFSSSMNEASPRVSVCTDSLQGLIHGSNPTSRSCEENGYSINGEKPNGQNSREKSQLSPENSYSHSRSESTSSAVSSIDCVTPALIEPEITMENSPSFSSQIELSNSWLKKGRIALAGSASEELTTSSHVKELVEDLKSPSIEVQTEAAEELRLLAKHNVENRSIIGQCGAIAPLLTLLYSDMKATQEHAVTALLNLSIDEANKAAIAESGAIEPLIHVLKTGTAGARENSAAALFSLSLLEEYKAKIGRSGAVKALVHLLGNGTLRGKKDAATALFNLSIFHENKARIVQAGAVKYLVELLDPATGMVEKAVALLSNLSTVSEGRSAIVKEGGIPLLVEIVETGSHRGKENGASVLLQLCLHSAKYCTLVLQEGAVPPLVALSQSGTTRAKEKAQQLLSHFRNQREGSAGKGKS